MRYLTVTFNITFPRCFVAKLRLLEFALHQDVVINYFNRRLIQNTADIISKCVARLQNAAIPITKCATLSQNASLLQNDAEHKLLLFIGFRTFLRTLFLWQWSKFYESLVLCSKQEFSTINQETFLFACLPWPKKERLTYKKSGYFSSTLRQARENISQINIKYHS